MLPTDDGDYPDDVVLFLVDDGAEIVSGTATAAVAGGGGGIETERAVDILPDVDSNGMPGCSSKYELP